MINFRYHIVSLTAVFLALVIGILMGTTVVSKATVDGLKANVRRAEARSAAVHRNNDELTGQLSTRTEVAESTDEALSDNALADTVDGQLTDVPVLVITTEAVNKDVLDATLSSLDLAGADVDGTLVVTDRLGDDGKHADRLRALFDVPERLNTHAVVARDFAAVLAAAALPDEANPDETKPGDPNSDEERAEGSEPTTTVRSDRETTTTTTPEHDETAEPDVLDVLLDEGYVKFRPTDGETVHAPLENTPDAADQPGYRYVVVSNPKLEKVDTTFLLPVVASTARLGPVPQVVATGPADLADPDSTDALLENLLERDGVDGHVSTVDNLNSFAGNVAVIYALVDAGVGVFGTYGIGATATAVIPEVVVDDAGRSDGSS